MRHALCTDFHQTRGSLNWPEDGVSSRDEEEAEKRAQK